MGGPWRWRPLPLPGLASAPLGFAGVERAGLSVPETEAAAHLPGRTLLQEVRKPALGIWPPGPDLGPCLGLHPLPTPTHPTPSPTPASSPLEDLNSGTTSARSRQVALSFLSRSGEEGLGVVPAFLLVKQDLACSGVIGSGLCVFSKHPIQEFTQHAYTLNGYPYMVRRPIPNLLPPCLSPTRKRRLPGTGTRVPTRCAPFGLQVHHSDWFCGKAVGLLVLHLSGLVLNAYVTHVSEGWHRQ